MKKAILLLFLAIANCIIAKADDVDAVMALAKRIIPSKCEKFEFKESPKYDSKDYFEISSMRGKIIISGNNANSMAMGLNYYIKYFCNVTVSWYSDVVVKMPSELPVLKGKIIVEAKVPDRFFLNYCTYGYSMPFWQWAQWERIIDWMALNGINMPLAITGQEAVWYKVWKKLGMSDKEIRSYFTGPTYLPWHRMANIDGWNGPLPMEWLDNQEKLQKKILARERELNMRPVLPAFAGHVPAELKALYPQANIQYLSKWAGFDNQYRCHFLNPEEPLFAEIQKLYLTEQTKLFGTDHIYGVDPFNEVDPPSWKPEYLKKISSNMYKTLIAVDKDAKWLQMAWMFYIDSDDWKPERVKALLTGVPQDKMMLLDYHCENVELWKTTDKFYGQPYIWCYLGNFGGNTTITGNVKESIKRLDDVLIKGGSNLRGIGSTLEGLDMMQYPYEYVFEKAWKIDKDNDEWINNLADRHFGKVSSPVREGWRLLHDSIYVQVPRTLGILPNYRPIFDKVNEHCGISYSNDVLIEAWSKLLQADNCDNDAFRVDLIVVGRQVLGNKFAKVKEEFDRAYIARDIPTMKSKGAAMQDILNDLENLTAFNRHSSLPTWISEARDMGTTPDIKDYYEKNARNLITTWGGSLNDYASRTWAGLIKSYYAPRWNLYINELISCCEKNINFDQEQFDTNISRLENNWVDSKSPISVTPNGNLLEFSRHLLSKYK